MADRVAEVLFIIDEFLRELDGARDDIRDPEFARDSLFPDDLDSAGEISDCSPGRSLVELVNQPLGDVLFPESKLPSAQRRGPAVNSCELVILCSITPVEGWRPNRAVRHDHAGTGQ